MSTLSNLRTPGFVLLLFTGGCSTLGGNVSGDFACRAPEGSCAPTSLIDATATGIDTQANVAPVPVASPASRDGRSLRIVLAAYRDEAGRAHEARVVHVTLPEPASASWRAPQRTGEVLRAIGNSIGAAHETTPPAPSNLPAQEPDVLLPPWQPVPASPGAIAPATGAPGGSAASDRVPHPLQTHGDEE
jgi:conjugal transfer pilus assembly protein TraV